MLRFSRVVRFLFCVILCLICMTAHCIENRLHLMHVVYLLRDSLYCAAVHQFCMLCILFTCCASRFRDVHLISMLCISYACCVSRLHELHLMCMLSSMLCISCACYEFQIHVCISFACCASSLHVAQCAYHVQVVYISHLHVVHLMCMLCNKCVCCAFDVHVCISFA